jgi:putative addiction module CopG family antidote
MTMRINIPADLEAFVQEKLEVGRYRDASEAITDGLRLLKERDAAEYESLRHLLNVRVKESKRGQSESFDAELLQGIRRRNMTHLKTIRENK